MQPSLRWWNRPRPPSRALSVPSIWTRSWATCTRCRMKLGRRFSLGVYGFWRVGLLSRRLIEFGVNFLQNSYCPQLRTAYKCTDQLLNDFRPCLEEDDFTIVQALSGIIPDAVDLMCKNEGEILFSKCALFDRVLAIHHWSFVKKSFPELEEPKYADCVAKIGDNFNECINTFLNGTDDWDISHLNQDQCK